MSSAPDDMVLDKSPDGLVSVPVQDSKHDAVTTADSGRPKAIGMLFVIYIYKTVC